MERVALPSVSGRCERLITPSIHTRLHPTYLSCRVKRSHRQHCVQVRADRYRSSGFTAGFITGGVIFGTLGFLFAPQISRALLTEDQKLRLPRFLEDEAVRDPEQTKQELSDKIAQLNAAIDDVSNQMKARDPKPETVVPEEVIA